MLPALKLRYGENISFRKLVTESTNIELESINGALPHRQVSNERTFSHILLRYVNVLEQRYEFLSGSHSERLLLCFLLEIHDQI